MFLMTLIMGTIITISSQSWMGTWMGLEINLLSFIPLINSKNNPLSSESSIKYFLVQSMASSIFLFSIIMIMIKSKTTNELLFYNKSMMIFMNSTLLMKLGAAPFHFWFPEIIEGLSWMNSLILMTWQKIAPFMVISYIIKFNSFITMIIITCSLIGSIGGLNQISLRKILVYSSINHIGWMLSTFLINEITWIMYFMIYCMISLSIIIILNQYKIFFIKQIFSMNNNNNMNKFFMFMSLLSLGGLPPFLGFFPKWMIIQTLSNYNYLLLLFMMTMTLITLFFYMRLCYSSMMILNNENNFLMMMNKNNKNNLMTNMMLFISINGLIMYPIFMNFY
uniref:NADH-ubiquinone oxidoreductase chain 2 n=1 Tax=Hygrotus inaequalis TaxID=107886 RepID=A0A191ZRK7_9DYTI|nr:NADH dehydrogenase subunit 2 [Hygrotus inaequalis]